MVCSCLKMFYPVGKNCFPIQFRNKSNTPKAIIKLILFGLQANIYDNQ